MKLSRPRSTSRARPRLITPISGDPFPAPQTSPNALPIPTRCQSSCQTFLDTSVIIYKLDAVIDGSWERATKEGRGRRKEGKRKEGGKEPDYYFSVGSARKTHPSYTGEGRNRKSRTYVALLYDSDVNGNCGSAIKMVASTCRG